MEIFTTLYPPTQAFTNAPNESQDLAQEFEAPHNRLTGRELKQLRAIREEIESRPRRTRFEERYIRVILIGEQEFCGIRSDCMEGIACVRELLKEAERKSDVAEKSITIAFLVAAIAKYTK